MRFLRSFCVQSSATSWKTSVIAIALIVMPHTVSAQVIISEFVYDTPGSDSKAEWIELQNTDLVSVDISRWKINDGSNHLFNVPPKNGSTGSLVIQPGSFLILAADAGSFIASHPDVHISVIDTVIDLSNSGGKITLIDASSTKVDSISYTTSRGAAGTGESLQKINGKLVSAIPTPGYENSIVKIAKKIVKAATVSAAHVKKTSRASTRQTTAHKTATREGNVKSVTALASDPVVSDATDTAQLSGAGAATAAIANLPQGSSGGSINAWMYGALALGVTGAGIAVVANQKKKGEWDIQEITD